MVAAHLPPGAPASRPGWLPAQLGPTPLPVSPSVLTSFLPLTLTVIRQRPGLDTLGGHAAAAELAAGESWQALLGDCAGIERRRFPAKLRLLSDAANEATRELWLGRGSTRRSRVREFERWVSEALDEGDGAGFATACARYDAALAGHLVSAPTPG